MASQVIRVLLVDASAAGRTAVKRVLTAVQRFELAGAVGNCEAALRLLHASAVDLVLVAEHLPDREGTTFIEQIRQDFRETSCILVGPREGELSRLEARALSSGATAAIAGLVDAHDRPVLDAHHGELFVAAIRSALTTGKSHAARNSHESHESSPPAVARASTVAPAAPTKAPSKAASGPVASSTTVSNNRNHAPMRIDAIFIGCSTGGPHALHRILGALPHDLPVPLVITQHVPAGFSVLLADQLSHSSGLVVREATTGVLLRPGEVWIAPHDRHLGFDLRSDGVVIRLRNAPAVHSCRPAVDPMLMEAAEVYGPRMLATVLTGMGYDGRDGCRRVAQAGGFVIAQDEATSVVWGMPGAVVGAGVANLVLPLDEISPAIVRQLSFGRNYSPTWKKSA